MEGKSKASFREMRGLPIPMIKWYPFHRPISNFLRREQTPIVYKCRYYCNEALLILISRSVRSSVRTHSRLRAVAYTSKLLWQKAARIATIIIAYTDGIGGISNQTMEPISSDRNRFPIYKHPLSPFSASPPLPLPHSSVFPIRTHRSDGYDLTLNRGNCKIKLFRHEISYIKFLQRYKQLLFRIVHFCI